MSGAIRGLHNLASRVIDGVDFVADNEDNFFLNHFYVWEGVSFSPVS